MSGFMYTLTRFKLRFRLVQFRPDCQGMKGRLLGLGGRVKCVEPLGEKQGFTLSSAERGTKIGKDLRGSACTAGDETGYESAAAQAA